MLQNLPVIKNLSPVQRSIAITVGALIFYELGNNTSLAFLLPAGTSPLAMQYFDKFIQPKLFGLGMLAALIGFFIVEILSFFLPPFKQYRAGGLKGRRQLTKWSLMASLLLAVLYASTLVRSIGNFRAADGQPLLGHVSVFHQGLLVLVLVLGFVMLCGLAELITRHGVGNGFSVIIGYGIVSSLPFNIYDLLTADKETTIPLELGRKNIMAGEPPNLVGLMVTIFIVVYFAQKFWPNGIPLFKNVRPNFIQGEAGGQAVNFELPRLPQGVFPLLWPGTVIMFVTSLNQFSERFTHTYDWFRPNTWSYAGFYILLLAGLSYLTYCMIAHPRRIAHNTMGKIKFAEGWKTEVHKTAVRAIIVITLIWLLWNYPHNPINPEFHLQYVISITAIISFFAISRDVWSQYRFLRQAENPRVLENFDNVHFVTYLKGLFEREGIRFCIQGFEYRRLFYFFEPLIKMRIMIDARDWDKANQLADLENVALI